MSTYKGCKGSKYTKTHKTRRPNHPTLFTSYTEINIIPHLDLMHTGRLAPIHEALAFNCGWRALVHHPALLRTLSSDSIWLDAVVVWLKISHPDLLTKSVKCPTLSWTFTLKKKKWLYAAFAPLPPWILFFFYVIRFSRCTIFLIKTC